MIKTYQAYPRYEIIKTTKIKAKEKMKELKQQLEVLKKKEAYYQDMIANNERDKCNPMNLKRTL